MPQVRSLNSAVIFWRFSEWNTSYHNTKKSILCWFCISSILFIGIYIANVVTSSSKVHWCRHEWPAQAFLTFSCGPWRCAACVGFRAEGWRKNKGCGPEKSNCLASAKKRPLSYSQMLKEKMVVFATFYVLDPIPSTCGIMNCIWIIWTCSAQYTSIRHGLSHVYLATSRPNTSPRKIISNAHHSLQIFLGNHCGVQLVGTRHRVLLTSSPCLDYRRLIPGTIWWDDKLLMNSGAGAFVLVILVLQPFVVCLFSCKSDIPQLRSDLNLEHISTHLLKWCLEQII